MEWITGNWYGLLPSPWASVVLVVIAILGGAMVGADREKKEKSAGLRTLSLVSLGAAVFTMVSFAVAGGDFDRGRIAAQIIPGIGFLGAGAILRGTAGIRGMTTAATIWAVAAVGMLVGAGYGGAGIGLSTTILLLLTLASAVERRYLGSCRFVDSAIIFEPTGGKTTVVIEDVLDDYWVTDGKRQKSLRDDGLMEMRFTYCKAHKFHREFLTRLATLPEVREIERD